MRIRREAASLASRHEVCVVDHVRGGGGSRRLDGFTVRSVPLVAHRLPSSPFFWPVMYLEFLLRATTAAIAAGADAYHGHEVVGALPAWIAARLRRADFVYDAHELELDRTGPVTRSWIGALHRSFVLWLLRRADRVICASEARSAVMVERYGLKTRPLSIMNVTPRDGLPEGPTAVWPAGPPPQAARLLVYQGVLTRGRGLANMVGALKHLPEDIVLVVVGDGAAGDDMRARAQADGTAGRLWMVGKVPAAQVVSYMRLAHAGIVIYRDTNLNNHHCSPNKLYDYCAAGVPIVGSDQPEIRSLVERFDVGALFDPEDPRSLARAVLEVVGDEEIRSRMARNAERVRSEINWEGQGERLLSLYAGLASERTQRR
ncbi:glycosyltransferase [bacterium]|nr:glycosyltransferase [bacterium]